MASAFVEPAKTMFDVPLAVRLLVPLPAIKRFLPVPPVIVSLPPPPTRILLAAAAGDLVVARSAADQGRRRAAAGECVGKGRAGQLIDDAADRQRGVPGCDCLGLPVVEAKIDGNARRVLAEVQRAL